MPLYEKAPAKIHKQALEVMAIYHSRLRDAGLTVDVLFARAKTDDNGDKTGPALLLHGYPCAAVAKIVSAKDRAKGMADTEITLDGDEWDTWSAEEQAAILDHELTHFELSVDDNGLVKRDDLSRPKLRMRKHDHQFGWFDSIARRHGQDSVEVQQAKAFVASNARTYQLEMFQEA